MMESEKVLALGGPVMYLIAALAVAAALIFIQRAFHLHRAQIKTIDFIRGIFNIVSKGNIVEAVSQCEETPGPVAQMVRMAILEREQGPERVRQAMQEVGLAEIPRLERNLSLLMTIGQLAPLAGLLGTVLGMMQMLAAMVANAPQIHAEDLSAGIFSALFTTAAGLAVAMPVYAGHQFLVARVESILLDMERVFGEVMMMARSTSGSSPADRAP